MAHLKGTPRPKGAGRKKGTPNKKTIDAQALADRLGCNPLEILLRFAMGDWEGLGFPDEMRILFSNGVPYNAPYVDPEMRLKAAKDAAEYLYPKRKALEHSGPNGTPINVTASPKQIEVEATELAETIITAKAKPDASEPAPA